MLQCQTSKKIASKQGHNHTADYEKVNIKIKWRGSALRSRDSGAASLNLNVVRRILGTACSARDGVLLWASTIHACFVSGFLGCRLFEDTRPTYADTPAPAF